MLRTPTLALFCAAALLAVAAHAHDTWFEPLPASARMPADGRVRLALGTGAQFPQQETGLVIEALVQGGCRSGATGAALVPWERQRNVPSAIWLRSAKPMPAGQALGCWAELGPFDLEMGPEKVGLYFDEIKAGPELRDRWKDIAARGKPWVERYVKFARTEFALPAGAATAPSGLAFDALVESPRERPKAGDTLSFQILRDGAPLPDFAVELRSDASPLGIWRRTDAQGRVRVALPIAGRWLLRGTDLRAAPDKPDAWVSRFIALTFEVVP